jgi:hypothetical protein
MSSNSTNKCVLTLVVLVLICAVSSLAQAPLPNPVAAFLGAKVFETGGKQFTRYSYDIHNKAAYPPSSLLLRQYCRRVEKTKTLAK